MAQQTGPGKPIVRVAAAIICHDGKILAAQRSYGPMKDGWEFPGGKIEEGEQPEDAVRRECAEELGLKLGVLWPFSTVEYDYPDFHLSMELFMGAPASGQEPQMIAHEALRWLDRNNLLSVSWLPADEEPVRALGLAWDELFDEMHL
ncbi:(deoxy)nucleoside triphosphate pyrophosphohydrolase [uncultured Parolsenella sp.]|uniref:(deoxy)nucleoside triphosphate pyrophosphohydrolase n=1 Tax=uncultured Parolsenella sp. TaxID=2083008 RepID=UPI0025EC7EA8|nr:(deoxy)nucleoside triphosphate pyrophosphohydrolase [uncultured Parolsenella sp.]